MDWNLQIYSPIGKRKDYEDINMKQAKKKSWLTKINVVGQFSLIVDSKFLFLLWLRIFLWEFEIHRVICRVTRNLTFSKNSAIVSSLGKSWAQRAGKNVLKTGVLFVGCLRCVSMENPNLVWTFWIWLRWNAIFNGRSEIFLTRFQLLRQLHLYFSQNHLGVSVCISNWKKVKNNKLKCTDMNWLHSNTL